MTQETIKELIEILKVWTIEENDRELQPIWQNMLSRAMYAKTIIIKNDNNVQAKQNQHKHHES